MSNLSEIKLKKSAKEESEAKKPAFPRPSSHYPREALKNRLLPRKITDAFLKAGGAPYAPMRPNEDPPPRTNMVKATGKRMLKGAPVMNANKNRESSMHTGKKSVTMVVGGGGPPGSSQQVGEGSDVHSVADTETTSSMTVKLEHVNMPRTLHREGLEKVAENLATDDRIFTYLTHEGGDGGNPYNFKFAKQAPADLFSKKYVTLSHKGISRAGESSLDIHEGKARIELETIDVVTLEAKQFAACRKINFFKNFRLWKPFQMWRRGIRNYLWRKRRKNVSNRMYASQPMVNALMILTVQCCQEIKALRPLRYASGDAYDLLIFLHQQKQLQRESRKKFKEILDKLLYVLSMEGDRLTLNSLQNLPPVIKALNMPKQLTVKELKDQAFLTSIVETVDSMASNRKGVKQGGKQDELLGSIAEEKSEVNLAYPPQNFNNNSQSQSHGGELGSFSATDSIVTTIGSVDNLGRPSFDLHSLHLPPRFGSSVLTSGQGYPGCGVSVSHSHFLSNMESINENSTTSGADKGLDNVNTVQGMETSIVYAEKDMTYTEKGAIRNKCRQMYAFYRMVALMLRDAHYDALEKTYQEQYDFLTGCEKVPRPAWRKIDIQKRIDDEIKAEKDREKVEAEEAKATAVAVEEMIAHRDDAETVANAVEHMNAKKHRHLLVKAKHANENEGYLDDCKIQSTALDLGVFKLVLVMDEISTFKETIASAEKARLEARNIVLGGQEQAIMREEMVFGDDSMASLEDIDMVIDDEPDTFTMKMDDIYSPPYNRTGYALTTNPTRSSVEKSFQSLMNSTKQVFGEVHNFLSESAFEALFYPIKDELDELDVGNGLFMDTSNSINELSSKSVDIVKHDLKQCLESLSNYQFLVEFYHQNIELQRDTGALELQLRDADTDDIADMISNCESQLQQCEALDDQEIVGILSLDLSIAKDKCITTLTDSRDLLVTLVPQLYVYHAGSFLADIERITKKLRSSYEQLEEYVGVVRLYRKTVIDKETYDHTYLHVQSILRLIEEGDIPHNTQSLHLVNTLGKSWHDFEENLADFEDNMPDTTKLCSKDILIRGRALTERSQESRLFLDQQQIRDPTSKSDLMIDEFSRLVMTMEAVVKEADLLEVYQMETKCSVFSKHAVVEIYDECTSNQILWIITQSITMAYADLFSSDFLDVKPDYFYKLLNESRCKIATEMKLRNNVEVETHVFALMEYIDRVLPVLSMMRAAEIKNRHQDMLKALLRNDAVFERSKVLEADRSNENENGNRNDNDSKTISDGDGSVMKEDDTRAVEGVETADMSEVVEEESDDADGENSVADTIVDGVDASNVHTVSMISGKSSTVRDIVDPLKGFEASIIDGVESIYKTAILESYIERAFQEVQDSWINKHFDMHYDNVHKIVTCSNLAALAVYTKDTLADLQSCLASPGVDFYREECEILYAQMTQSDAFIRNLITAQNEFLALKLLFSNSRTARHLNTCSAAQKASAEHFKRIAQILKHDPLLCTLTSLEVHDPESGRNVLVTNEMFVCLEKIQELDNLITAFMNAQRSIYPRLYLLSDKEIRAVMTEQDVEVAYQYCARLLPNICNIMVDPGEPTNIIGGYSSDAKEKIMFLKPVSARMSIGELLLALDTSCAAVIRSQIEHFVVNCSDGLDYRKTMLRDNSITATIASASLASTGRIVEDEDLSLEQSRLCAIQVNFWNRLTAHISDFKSGKADMIKTNALLVDAKDRIVNDIDALTSLVRSTVVDYTRVTAANTMIELIKQRDFVLQCLQSIENESNPSSIAASPATGKAQKVLRATNGEISLSQLVDNAIKKTTPDAPSTYYVVVQQSNLSFNYGYGYQGFNNALFLTPLTERCFLTLNKATQSNQICLLEGHKGIGKKSVMRSLAIETGCTSFHVDVSSLGSDTLRSHILASVGCCHWLCLHNIDTLTSALLGEMFSMLTSAQKVMDMARMLDTPGITILEEAEVQALTCTIDGISVSVPKKFIQMPLFVTTFDGNATSRKKLLQHIPQGLLRKFRPIHCHHHSWHALLCMLLTYCTSKAGVSITKPLHMARRLEAVCKHVAAEALSDETTALDLLIKALLLTDVSSISDIPKSIGNKKDNKKNATMFNSNKSKEDLVLQEVMKVYLSSLPTINVAAGCLQKEYIQRLYKTICSLFLGLNTDSKTGGEYIEDCLSQNLLERESDEMASEALTTLDDLMDKVYTSQEDEEKEPVPQTEVSIALERWEDRTKANLDKKQQILLECMQSQQHRVSSTIVVGSSGVGKSELIQEVFVQMESYSDGSAVQYNKKKMNVALDSLYYTSQDDQSNTLRVDNMISLLSAKVLQEGFSIKNFGNFGDLHPTALVHVDINRSEELELLRRSQEILEMPIHCNHHAARIVYECEELTHASPQVLNSAPIVYIQTVLYSYKSFLNRCVSDLCSSRDKPIDESYRKSKSGHSSSQYMKTQKSDSELEEKLQQTYEEISSKIMALVEYYITPCMSKCHAFDPIVEPNVLVQQCLRMVETLLDAFSVNTHTYQQQCQEDNMERIFVFALIWTFGVCSTKSREAFDAWFKYQYFHDITHVLESHEHAVYEHGGKSYRTASDRQSLDLRRTRCPPLLDGLTVFDLVLEPIEDEAGLETHISWVLWNQYGSLKGDPRLEYLFATHSRLPLPSKVSSLLDEERLQHAYVVGGISQGTSYDNLLLPSNDSVALSLVQGAALQSSKGMFHIISGTRGSGKTTLFQQLAMEQELDHLDRYFDVGKQSVLGDRHRRGCRPWALSSRWVCQSNIDSATGAKQMMNHLQKGRDASLDLHKGQAGHFLGALIVEDCNLCASPAFDSNYGVNNLCPTALDVLRRIGDANDTHVENVMDSTVYCLAQANALSMSMRAQWSHRSLRHFKVTCTSVNEAEMTFIFSAKLQEKCSQWSEDSISDIILLTQRVVQAVRQRLGAGTASTYFDLVDNSRLLDSMKLLHIFQPAESAVSQLLSTMAVALQSLPIFTSNDTLRIWDKVSNDYFANYFPSTAKATASNSGCTLLDVCVDETLSDPDVIDKFRLNSFHALMRRERSTRADNDKKKGLDSYLGLTSYQRNDAPDGAAMIYSWSKCQDDMQEKFSKELMQRKDIISDIVNLCRFIPDSQSNDDKKDKDGGEGKDITIITTNDNQTHGEEEQEQEEQEGEEEEQLLAGLLDGDDDEEDIPTATDCPRELLADHGSIRFWSDIVRLTSALAYPSLHGNVEKLVVMGPSFRMIDTCVFTSALYMAVLAKTNAPRYLSYQVSHSEDLNEVLQAMSTQFIREQSQETKDLQAAVASRRMSQFSMKDKDVIEDDHQVSLWHLHVDIAPGSTPAENAWNTTQLLNRDFVTIVAYLLRADLCAFAAPTHVAPYSQEGGGSVLSQMTKSAQSLFVEHNINVHQGHGDRQLLHEYSSRQRVILSFRNEDICTEFMHQMSNVIPSFWSDVHINYLSCYRKAMADTDTENNNKTIEEFSSFQYKDAMMVMRRACISKDLDTMRTFTARLMADDRVLIRCARTFMQAYSNLPSRISDDEMIPGFLQGNGYNSGSSGYSSANSRTGTPTRRSRKKNKSPDGLSVKERRRASIITANTSIATYMKEECRAYNESLSTFGSYVKDAIDTRAQMLRQEVHAHFAHLTRHMGFNHHLANPLQRQQCFDELFMMADTLIKLQCGLTPEAWLRRQPCVDNLSKAIGDQVAASESSLQAYLSIYRDLRRSLVTHITNLGSTELENASVLPLKLHTLKYSQTLLYCLTNSCKIESLYMRGESIHSEDNEHGYDLQCRLLSSDESVSQQQQSDEQYDGEGEKKNAMMDTTGEVVYRATMRGYPTLYCRGLTMTSTVSEASESTEVAASIRSDNPHECSYRFLVHERTSPTAFKTNLHSSRVLHDNATAPLCSLSTTGFTILPLPVTVCFEKREEANGEVEDMISFG